MQAQEECATRFDFSCRFPVQNLHFFLTTSARFAERLRPLRLPAFFLTLPFFLLPAHTFRFKLANFAFFLKHSVQNFARGEVAEFVQRGMLHLLTGLAFMLAPFAMRALEPKCSQRGSK